MKEKDEMIEDDKNSKFNQKNSFPKKIIKTNRAECNHIKDNVNFNLFDYVDDEFFSNEKAIQLKKEENITNQKERDKLFQHFMSAVHCLERVSDEDEDKKEENENENINN